MDYHNEDLVHKYEVRLILEEVTFSPTKVILVRDEDDEWVKSKSLDYEEAHRREDKMEQLYEGDSEEAEMRFEQAIFRLKTKSLTQGELKELAKAIAWGMNTITEAMPLDGQTVNTVLRNTLSEIAHSMNRKGLVTNDDVGTFVADLYTEMKV